MWKNRHLFRPQKDAFVPVRRIPAQVKRKDWFLFTSKEVHQSCVVPKNRQIS
jgi:hypothetical protein